MKKIALAVLVAGLILNCGKKKEDAVAPALVPPGGSDVRGTPSPEGFDSTGYLVFSPPAGTYQGPKTVVVRPRAIETTRPFTFEVLNAKVSACPDNGPTAMCVTLDSDKVIEYIVKVRRSDSSYEMTQIPGSAEYLIDPAPPVTPTPEPTVPPEMIQTFEISGTRYSLFKSGCSSDKMYFSLMNNDTVGQRKVIWFWMNIPDSWELSTTLLMNGGADLSDIKANGDDSPVFSGGLSAWVAKTCNIDRIVLDGKPKIFAANINCEMKKYSNSPSQLQVPETFQVVISNAICLSP